MVQQCLLLQKTILYFSLDSLVVTEQCNNGTSKNIKFIE